MSLMVLEALEVLEVLEADSFTNWKVETSLEGGRLLGNDALLFISIGVTTANKITFFRIFLIPIFAATASLYGVGLAHGAPRDFWRWAALGTFFVASVSDGVDGYIARHHNQRTELGRLLDPLADMTLLLVGVLTFSFVSWYEESAWRFPLWFATVVVARNSLSIFAAFAINYSRRGAIEVRPHWTGKVGTVGQMVAVCWVMLQFPRPEWPTNFAGTFVVASGAVYIWIGSRQYWKGYCERKGLA